jgi:hypothetical protein
MELNQHPIFTLISGLSQGKKIASRQGRPTIGYQKRRVIQRCWEAGKQALSFSCGHPELFPMNRLKGHIERRQSKRFKVAEGAFAALINHSNKLGQIKDISEKGLSFRYIGSEAEHSEARELKIILGNGGLCLEGIPFKEVSDFEIKREFSFSSIRMRRIGLEFGELTPEQQARLSTFIQNHTIGEA